MKEIVNNSQNRKALFKDDIAPVSNGFSVILGKEVHITKLYEDGAEGKTKEGKSWAYLESLGLKANKPLMGLCDAKISEEEKRLLEKEKKEKFFSSHTKTGLYTIESFSDWTRFFTSACYDGRRNFLRKKGFNLEDKCNVSFWLKEMEELAPARALIPKEIFDYYGSEEPIYIKEENSNE